MLKSLGRICKVVYYNFRRVHKKNLTSSQHRTAWKKFERILAIRCNIVFGSTCIFYLLALAFGKASFQRSTIYVTEGLPHNEKFVQEFSSFLELAIIWMTFGRIALILASYKFPSITRIYIYYQTIFMCLEWCLPQNYGDMADKILFTDNFLYFLLLYYDFTPSFISLVFPVAVKTIMDIIHYD